MKEMKDSKRITFEVSEEFHKEVKIKAIKKGLSVRELAEKALKEYLTKESKTR